MSLPRRGCLLLLILFFSYSYLQAQAFYSTGQVDTSNTENSAAEQSRYKTGITGRWQSRLGISSLADRGYFSLPLFWELPRKFTLQGIQLQPAISWGYLHRNEDRDELHPEYDEFTDYYEGIFYGIFEIHKQWRIWQGMLGGSLHTGFGLGSYAENYYNLFEETTEWYRGVSWIASAGIQVEAKVPELPTMVSDVRFFVTPNYGASYVVSYGIRGKLLQIISAWGLIIATYILLEG
jgi:hypothetical protein